MKKFILVALLIVPTMLMAQSRDKDEYTLPTWNIKTNLLSDITTTMNLGIEFRTGGHTSIDIPVSWNPWSFSGGSTRFQHIEVKPEFRYWLKETFRGHWFDIHAGWADYNVGGLWNGPFTQYMKDNRFDGQVYGVGIGWGYRWNFSRHWGLEATVGVGYAHLDYDQYAGQYACLECDEALGNKTKNYFGPTKLGLNLIFGFGAKKIEAPAPEPIVVVERYEPMFEVVFITPAAEPVKVRQESGKAYLEYVVGKSDIVKDFRNNATELALIEKTINDVKNNSDATITSIGLYGWASPEGTWASNMKLSENRAASLERYIETNYGIDSKVVEAEGKGEDWATLGDLVEASNVAHKDEIIRIINNGTPDYDIREREIRAIDGGRPYNAIKTEIYPKLRRTDYFIDYEVAPISTERAREVILIRPAHLSLNEMFLVADSYSRNSREYHEAMEIAARTYPNSDVANMNAAASALERGDATVAAAFLGKIKDQNSAWQNNMGILSWLQGNKERAEAYFKAGGNQAAVNAAELEKHLKSMK